MAMLVSSDSKMWSMSGNQGWGLLARANRMCEISIASRLLLGRLFLTWL